MHTPSDANPIRTAVSTPSNTQTNAAQHKTAVSHHPSSLSMYVSTRTPVLLQTARAIVYRPDSPTFTEITRVILDGGSQRSYITGRLREALTLPTQSSESLVIKMFGSEGGRAQTCDVVNLGVRTRDGAHVDLKLLVVPLICEPLSGQPVSCASERFPHLFGLEMADTSTLGDTLDIDVLIGADYYWQFATGNICRGTSGPTGIETKLGWVLSGPVPGYSDEHHTVNLFTSHALHIDTASVNSLDERLKMFWELETLGIKEDETSVYDNFINSIQLRVGRYCVKLPWKDPCCDLPSNYDLCQKRLHGLLRRLKQDTHLLKEYDGVIREQLTKGIVEVVGDLSPQEHKRIHYLPHHAVIREEKQTTKLRIVYDASAKSTGPSLNDCLYVGPAFGQSIMDILLRFRLQKVALVADIEKAFLMISVDEDRDVLRFLWIEDIESETPRTTVLRFARVVFGVASSPFLLNATIRHHIQGYQADDPSFVARFLNSIYVDDLTFGADSIDEAFELYTKSKARLAEAGFNLRKFCSNSMDLLERISQKEQYQSAVSLKSERNTLQEEDQSYARHTVGANQSQPQDGQRVLGLLWDSGSDQFIFDISQVGIDANLEPKKRDVVSLASRIFDPMGILSPVTIQFKVLFQKICELKIGWDDYVSGDPLKRWKSLIHGLAQSSPLCIPRYLFQHVEDYTDAVYSLQGFSDASQEAYAAVIYLKVVTSDAVQVRLVASKTRVAPAKGMTIPRLELLAALLLSKLMVSVRCALEPELALNDPSCFTDSKVTLYWIQGQTKEWKQFVQNRVREIRRLLPIHVWKHCSGHENPADIPSRGMNLSELVNNPLWLNGPKWLCNSGGEKLQVDEDCVPEGCLDEMKVTSRQLMQSTHSLISNEHDPGEPIMECKDFSTLRRLLRITAHVFKVIEVLKAKIGKKAKDIELNITATDMAKSELYWIKMVQHSLERNVRFIGWKQQFNMFMDETGVWRCGGRLTNADMPQLSKHPILLEITHPFTTLIVKDCHEKVMHNGVRETLSELRSRYWIVRGRSFIRRVLHECFVCKKMQGQHYVIPPSPPLPEFRVQQAQPFSSCGVDYAGPLYLKDTGKVWISLFTCCVTRAIHLELVPDMTADAFLRCFKRFTARRGVPSRVISDNSKTFKSASRLIFKLLESPEVRKYFGNMHLTWNYNLEKAPWWGGMFERMIRSMKMCLKKAIGGARL